MIREAVIDVGAALASTQGRSLKKDKCHKRHPVSSTDVT